jgi:hypothetical protein
MRDIRFSGKSVETGEVVVGSLINNMFFKSETGEPVYYIIDTQQYEDYSSFEDIEYLAVKVDPDTIIQYTGARTDLNI